MINKEINGDLIKLALDNEFDAIVHGANCFNTMGKGIAYTIRKVFPEAYEADKKTKKGDKNKLGDYSYVVLNIKQKELFVINAYTQYDYRITSQKSINVDYEAIRKVFTRINKDFKGLHIGIPRIGAGLAGGDWDKIKTIINEVTPDIDIILVNYSG